MSDVSQGPGWWQATDGRWYPPQPPPGDRPPKPVTRRLWFWALIVVALGVGGCVTVVATKSVAVNHAAHTEHNVVYKVTGSGPAFSVTAATLQQGNGQNGQSQLSNVHLPWSKTVRASGSVIIFNLSATVGIGGGSVTCSITEDGNTRSTNTATGAFSTATCTAAGT
jgi:hypothetical protein